MKKILITGANSYIGVSFENYIKQRYPESFIVHTIDMTNSDWENTNFSEYDVIFHVAGIAHRKETKENKQLYYSVNYDLALKTAQKAQNEGVKQFIFLSSMSVYGVDMGVITECTPLHPKSNYGKSKLLAENAISQLESKDFCVTVIRPPMVYGLGCRGNFNSLIKIAEISPVFPNINNQRSMIYIDNLSEFVKLVIDKEFSGICIPQNNEYVNTCDIAKMAMKARGKKLHLSTLLGLCVRMLFPFIGIAKKAFGNLIYDKELENFGFEYCVVQTEDSIKKSIVSEE